MKYGILMKYAILPVLFIAIMTTVLVMNRLDITQKISVDPRSLEKRTERKWSMMLGNGIISLTITEAEPTTTSVLAEKATPTQ